MRRSRSTGSPDASRRPRRWSGAAISTRSWPRRSGAARRPRDRAGRVHEQQRRGRRRAERPAARSDGGDVSRTAPSPFAVRGVHRGLLRQPVDPRAAPRDDPVHRVAHGMNTFVYAPKDDPLVRRRWRSRMTGTSSRRLPSWSTCRAPRRRLRVLRLARASRSATRSRADPRPLLAKLAPVGRARREPRSRCSSTTSRRSSQHAEDRAALRGPRDGARRGRQRGSWTASGPDRASSCARLVYCGRGDEPYLADAGRAALDPRVDLFWTGRAICSPTLDADDAAAVRRDGRPPAAVLGQLPGQRRRDGLGAAHRAVPRPRPAPRRRLARRRRQRDGAVRGVEDPVRDDRRLPRRSRGYDPEASGARAIREVAGETTPRRSRLRRQRPHHRACPRTTRRSWRAALETFAFGRGEGRDGDAGRLAEASPHARGHAARRRGPPAARDGRQRRPSSTSAGRGSRRSSGRPGHAPHRRPRRRGPPAGRLDAVTAELLPYLAELRRRRVRVFGDALDMILADTTDHPCQAREAAPGRRRRSFDDRKIARLAARRRERGRAARRVRRERAPAENDHVLRVAMGSPGEAQIRVWDDVAAQYMAAHPETKVEMNYQQDDLYQTIGLPEPAGRQERAGRLLRVDRRAPQASARGRLRRRHHRAVHVRPAQGPVHGRHAQGLQHRRQERDGPVLGRRHQRPLVQQGAPRARPASSRPRRGRSCSPRAHAQRRRASSRSRPATRTCGRPATGSATWRRASWARTSTRRPSSGTGKFATPEWETAFGYIKRAGRRTSASTTSANAIDDNAGAQLFFQGKAAMHPIGSLARLAGRSTRRPTSTSTTSTCRPCPAARATRTASSASRRATSSTPRAPRSRRRPSSWRSSTAPRTSRSSSRPR